MYEKVDFRMYSYVTWSNLWDWLLISYASLVEAGAWSTMLNMFPIVGFGELDGFIVILFYVIAIVGMVISIKALKETK